MKTPYQVSRDLDELSQKIRELQQRIDAAPEGGIYCSYIHGKQRYYNVKNGKKKYITEDNRQLALALARKHQDKKRLYESFPDFTIMHPLTGKIYYWEHFGMLDDDEYCRKAGMKMMRYLQDGISPASNLIITCEDSRHPLTVDHIIAVIDYYFGDVVWDGTIPESVEELLKTA